MHHAVRSHENPALDTALVITEDFKHEYPSFAKVVGFERMKQLRKPCIVCGREIQWCKKWQDNWNQVKYCSRGCRNRGLRDIDIGLEKVILDLYLKAPFA
jgi:hypothetical protein